TRSPLHQRHQRSSIDIRRSRNPRKVVYRWRKIDHLYQSRLQSWRRNERRKSQREWYPAGFLVDPVLAAQPVLRPEQSVVGIEHDQRVVQLALVPQLVDQIFHDLI